MNAQRLEVVGRKRYSGDSTCFSFSVTLTGTSTVCLSSSLAIVSTTMYSPGGVFAASILTLNLFVAPSVESGTALHKSCFGPEQLTRGSVFTAGMVTSTGTVTVELVITICVDAGFVVRSGREGTKLSCAVPVSAAVSGLPGPSSLMITDPVRVP